MNPGLMPGARKDKSEVNYRQREQCLNCDHFFNSGSCDLVAGNISPANVCDLFEIKSTQSPYKDKEFFVGQYEKANKK